MIKFQATRAFLSQPIQLRKCSLLELPGVKDLQPNLVGVATAPLAGSWRVSSRVSGWLEIGWIISFEQLKSVEIEPAGEK